MSKRKRREGINFVISIQLKSEHRQQLFTQDCESLLLLPMHVREPLPKAKKLRSDHCISVASQTPGMDVPIWLRSRSNHRSGRNVSQSPPNISFCLCITQGLAPMMV